MLESPASMLRISLRRTAQHDKGGWSTVEDQRDANPTCVAAECSCQAGARLVSLRGTDRGTDRTRL